MLIGALWNAASAGLASIVAWSPLRFRMTNSVPLIWSTQPETWLPDAGLPDAGTCNAAVVIGAATLAPAVIGPKMASCWLLATNTCPLATTGTIFAFPGFGQVPAVAENRREPLAALKA